MEIGAKLYEEKIIPIEKPRFNSAGYQVNMKDLNGGLLPNLEKMAFRPFKQAELGLARGAWRLDARQFSCDLAPSNLRDAKRS